MQKRHIVYNIQGMGLDVVSSPLNTTMAYEIKNMRLTPTGDSNALELTTERGTLKILFVEIPEGPNGTKLSEILDATVIGYCIIQNYIVLFIKGDYIYDGLGNIIGGPDYIYRLEQWNGMYKSKLLFEGNLNFDVSWEIEATSYFENTKIQKVYWVDGRNQPRVINIYGKEDDDPLTENPTFPKIGIGSYEDVYTEFDFLQEVLKPRSSARIFAKKVYTGGNFTAGVIQYAYSLYNLNSQETPLIDVTSLNYITNYDRGGAPNEQCGCSFEINILNNNLINDFDYIRVYSILRNSLNGTPLARVVADVPFDNDITIIDDGNGGYDVDYNQIQFLRLPIRPLTLTQKDNVLFIGNYNVDVNTQNMTHLYEFDSTDDLDPNYINIETDNWYPYDSAWDSHYGVEVYDPNEVSVYLWKNLLDTESAGVKTFKYLETYKLGVLFQDKYGNWSLPYFIIDKQQDKYPIINNGKLQKPIFKTLINKIFDLMQGWEKDLYVRIRPVVSFPSLTERSVLCQGVLNPTVFNITERCNKTCYALSSWFFRPFIPDRDYTLNDEIDNNETYYSQINGAVLNYGHYLSLNSSMDIGGEIQGMYYPPYKVYITPDESRIGLRTYYTIEDQRFIDNINVYKNFYYVDQSVLTLNSSDIDFNELFNSINFDNYTINIDGIIPLNSSVGKYRIISQNPSPFNNVETYRKWAGLISHDKTFVRSGDLPYGFYDHPLINNYGNGVDARGILCALNCWFDDVSTLTKFSNHVVGETGSTKWNANSALVSYYVYPWQRPYLNNYANGADQSLTIIPSDDYGVYPDSESSKIETKILANLRYSLNKVYFQNNFNLETNKICLCNSNSLVKISDTKIYKGSSHQYYSYNNQYDHIVFGFNDDLTPGLERCETFHDTITGYPITVLGLPTTLYTYLGILYTRGHDFGDTTDNLDFEKRINISKPREFFDIFEPGCWYHGDSSSDKLNVDRLISPNGRSMDSIDISYKSSPHIVFQLNTNEYSGRLYLAPTLERQLPSASLLLPPESGYSHVFTNNYHVPWEDTNYDENLHGYTLMLLDNTNINNNIAYLLSASLYKKWTDLNGNTINNPYLNKWNVDDPTNPYLENQSNLYLRNWLPCGKSQEFSSSNTNDLVWMEGDTYYQRYDCVKTKQYNENDYQSVIEMLSFMVESNINLDGRYDKNRGILDYTIISDDNFNLFNDVYNQENNFFTYHILDPAKFNIDEFKNDIVWSAKKVSGESIDQWTKLSPVNQLQLDGNKGFVKALRKFNDNIYCFQDHAISRIRFNDRTAIATESGEPLQLAYTNYVDGYEYVNSDIGCQYGISCCETENGIFFIDNDIPGIYKLSYNEYGNINVKSISRERFMQHWFEKHGNVLQERVFFDKMVNEILFLNKTTNGPKALRGPHCLVYSCDMNSFLQFIDDYGKSKYITTHNEWPISITDINGSVGIWKLRSYKYSQFLSENNTPSPYSITLVASPLRSNEGLFLDCIYDNVSFKSNVFRSINDSIYNNEYQPNESFNHIIAQTVYQSSNEALQFTNQPTHSITNLRKKFGSWFARIPKFSLPNSESVYGRYNKERMRGNYLFFTLEKRNLNINDKMVLTELSVDCFY